MFLLTQALKIPLLIGWYAGAINGTETYTAYAGFPGRSNEYLRFTVNYISKANAIKGSKWVSSSLSSNSVRKSTRPGNEYKV